jgi:hypothetical protein
MSNEFTPQWGVSESISSLDIGFHPVYMSRCSCKTGLI